MIRDLNDVPDDGVIESDVCIIGAGAAGITLAHALSPRGLDITLLEAGSLDFDPASQNLYKGRSLGRPYSPLDGVRLRYFGGTTNHWTGWCRPLDAVDFERHHDNDDDAWPFGLDVLTPYYRKAQEVCQLGAYDYSGEYWSGKTGSALLPLNASTVETAIIQISPPTRFGEVYRSAIEKQLNVRVYLNANVVDLLLEPSGGAVSGVKLATLNDKRCQAKARLFVLAAGGLENPRILLNATGYGPGGVGNEQGLVGRFFMEHPFYDVGELHLTTERRPSELYFGSTTSELRTGNSSDKALRIKGLLRLTDDALRREKLSNTLFWFTEGDSRRRTREVKQAISGALTKLRQWKNIHTIDDDVAIVASNLDLIGEKLFDRGRVRKSLSITAMIEQRPNYWSRVKLGDELDMFGNRRIVLDWRWDSRDKDSLRRSLEIVGQAVGAAGLGRVKSVLDKDALNLGNNPATACHHMGTTRVSENPRRGVVDVDCRVHTVDNLYISGCSVFPTGGASNPTLTIVALALRLADHIAERLS